MACLHSIRKAAAAMHPGAMLRLGTAEIKGELGLPRKPREGFKWIKRAAELADVEDDNNAPSEFAVRALHELGLLHEYGIEHVVFVDMDYAAECFARASELGYAPSAYRLGEYYEYGRSGIPQDSALSIHYYSALSPTRGTEVVLSEKSFGNRHSCTARPS